MRVILFFLLILTAASAVNGDPMPTNNDILASSQMPIFDDQLMLARVERDDGSIILAPTSMASDLQSWTGQVPINVPAAQAVAEIQGAVSGRWCLVIGGQLSRPMRDLLTSKGYRHTMHFAAPLSAFPGAPQGGVLFQSQMPIFDDQLTL